MSLSILTTRNTYTGNGATSVYAYTFKILLNTDLLVTKRLISTGVETTLTLTTDYTVSGVGNSTGGNVTLVAGALSALYKITIRRVRPLTQSTDIRNQTAFYASSHEDVFDNLTMITQQLQDQLDRSLKLPETFSSSDFNTAFPVALIGQANLSFVTDATGTKFIAGPSVGALANVAVDAATASAAAAAALISQTAAAASATAASGSATAAAASATAASGSATAAAASASAAATSAGLFASTANTIKGNNTGGTLANPLDLTPAQTAAMLPAVVGDSGSGGTKGLVPAPASGDAAANRFLKADGTWTAPAGAGTVTTVSVVSANGFAGSVANATSTPAITLSCSITGLLKSNGTTISAASSGTDYGPATSGLGTGILKSTTGTGVHSIAVAADFPTLNQNTSGSAASVSGTNTVTNANLVQMAANSIKGNNTGSTANQADLTQTQVRALISKAPTFSTLTSSGTYTVPANVVWLRVRMCGGGSGGSGSGTSVSTTGITAGSNTTFGLHTANGGGVPSSGIQGGAGGSGTIGAGGSGAIFVGGPGGGSSGQLSTFSTCSGSGGSSQLGGGGPGTFSANPGVVGQGYGGGGSGGGLGAFTGATGAGGGSGGTVDIVIAAPAATYSYAVGAAGAGASAGTSGQVGGNGAAGTIIVEEYYV